MTMMIMRFHRLIQSRLLWSFFLAVVVITFVFWGVAGSLGDGSNAANLQQPVAHLDGKPITILEYDVTRSLLERFQADRINRDTVEDAVYTRIAMVRLAKTLGLTIPEEEIRQQYAMNFVDEEGKYQETFRNQFVLSLRGSNLKEQDVLNYFGNELLIQQLQRVLSSYALVSPFDTERWASQQTDAFQLDYATVSPAMLTNEVVVSPVELQTFFTNQIENFRLPEMRRVAYFAMPIPDLSGDTNLVSDAEAESYYQANPDQFSRRIEPAADATNDVADTELIPYDEVKADILSNLRQQKSVDKVSELAMSYAVRLTPRRGRAAPAMETLASQIGVNVNTTRVFAARDFLQTVQASGPFIQAAFELDETTTGKVSQPVVGRTEVYVMKLLEIQPPRLPAFDEVQDRVAFAATNVFTARAVASLGSNLVSELTTLMATQTNFLEAASGLGLSVTSTPPFQLRDISPYNSPVPRILAQTASGYSTGDVFGPLGNERMDQLIGYVQSRTPQPEEVAELTPELRGYLAQEIQLRGFITRFHQDVLLADLVKVRNETDEETSEETAAE